MISIKEILFIYTLTFVVHVFGQQQTTSTNSQESLLKQLFANQAPVLKPQETLQLLKTLRDSLKNNDNSSKTLDSLANDLDNLIEAGENTSEKCKSDLFVDYITLMRHLDPKTYRLMVVLDYYNGLAWNENIFNYLKYYHYEQYKLCVNSFREATKTVSSKDLETIETLAKSVQNGGSNAAAEIAFPLIVPDDIERAVLNLIKPKLKDDLYNNKKSLLSLEGLYKFSEEFDKIKQVCSRFQNSISDHVQFAQQAYFSYLRDKVNNDKLLIRWAFYSDVCQLIDAVSEPQKMEFIQSLTKTLDK